MFQLKFGKKLVLEEKLTDVFTNTGVKNPPPLPVPQNTGSMQMPQTNLMNQMPQVNLMNQMSHTNLMNQMPPANNLMNMNLNMMYSNNAMNNPMNVSFEMPMGSNLGIGGNPALISPNNIPVKPIFPEKTNDRIKCLPNVIINEQINTKFYDSVNPRINVVAQRNQNLKNILTKNFGGNFYSEEQLNNNINNFEQTLVLNNNDLLSAETEKFIGYIDGVESIKNDDKELMKAYIKNNDTTGLNTLINVYKDEFLKLILGSE